MLGDKSRVPLSSASTPVLVGVGLLVLEVSSPGDEEEDPGDSKHGHVHMTSPFKIIINLRILSKSDILKIWFL